jgi:hypothetical protein
MKQTFLDFTKVHYFQRKRYLPKTSLKFARQACYKSDGEADDEKKKLLLTIEKRTKKLLEGRASKEDVDAIAKQLIFLTKGKNDKGEDIDAPFPIVELRAMADPKSGVMQKMIDMGEKIQKLETSIQSSGKDMSVRAQVAAWQEKNKAQLLKVMAGESKDVPQFELDLRVASPMLVSTVNSGSSPYIGRTEIESGINPILRYDTTFWDYLRKGRTGAATYVWVNQTNPLGAAAFIGPGVAKPGISFELVAENSVAKKIADSAKAGTELLQDIDGMTSFIMDELRVQVMQKVNEQLMTGAVSSTNVAGIQSLSQNFAFYTGAQTNFNGAAAALKTTNPTKMDDIRAVIAALRSGKIKGRIVVFVNPVEMANMDMSKATDSGVYLIPPFVTSDGRTIAGAAVVEDNNVPTGYIQAAFIDYYRILIYKDFAVTWGWENDDFTMRLHQMFNTKYTGAFLYDTFDNINAAITAA